MLHFTQFLAEVFDSPVKWKYEGKTKARFTVNSKDYKVVFTKIGKETHVSFGQLIDDILSTDQTAANKDQFIIFATVFDIMAAYQSQNLAPTDTIEFHGVGKAGQLYTRMAGKYAGKYGFQVLYVRETMSMTLIGLKKK